MGGLNGAERGSGRKRKMEDECVEVCDDCVRNPNETGEEAAGFTAPRPTCLDLCVHAVRV